MEETCPIQTESEPLANPAIAGRLVFVDTETTGLEPPEHRVVEVAAVEMVDGVRTGRKFHRYANPGRDSDPAALKAHGLTTERLAGEPAFAAFAPELATFLEGSRLVAHNAPFDVNFIDAEFARAGLPPVETLCEEVVDSLAQAREKFPNRRNNLDALCKRFGVDASRRVLHGALLDAELLADVYVRMHSSEDELLRLAFEPIVTPAGPPRGDLVITQPTDAERAAHQRHLEEIRAASGDHCLWLS